MGGPCQFVATTRVELTRIGAGVKLLAFNCTSFSFHHNLDLTIDSLFVFVYKYEEEKCYLMYANEQHERNIQTKLLNLSLFVIVCWVSL